MGWLMPLPNNQTYDYSTAGLRAVRSEARSRRGFGLPSGNYKINQDPHERAKKSGVKLLPPGKAEAERAEAAKPKPVKPRKVTKVAAEPTPEEQMRWNDLALGGDGTGNALILAAQNHVMPWSQQQFLAPASGTQPRKLTEEAIQEVLLIIRDGGSRGDAADAVGVSRTLIGKLADNNEAFAAALTQAEALGKLELIKRVRYGDSNWQSAAWMLERKYRKEFSLNQNPEAEDKVVRVRQVVPNKALLPGGQRAGGDGTQLLPTAQELENQAKGTRVVQADDTPPGRTSVESGIDAVINPDGSEAPVRGQK